jgi:hypothetical protein
MVFYLARQMPRDQIFLHVGTRLDIKRSSFDRGDHLFFLQKRLIVKGSRSEVFPTGSGSTHVASIRTPCKSFKETTFPVASGKMTS